MLGAFALVMICEAYDQSWQVHRKIFGWPVNWHRAGSNSGTDLSHELGAFSERLSPALAWETLLDLAGGADLALYETGIALFKQKCTQVGVAVPALRGVREPP